MKLKYFYILIYLLALLANSKLTAQITVTVPDTTGIEDKKITIPIYVSDLTNKNIKSYKFKLLFDSKILKAKKVKKNGTLSDRFGWRIDYDINRKNVIVEADGWLSLKNSGPLIKIEFEVIAEEGSSKLRFDYFKFNNGSPVPILNDGEFWVKNLKEVKFNSTGNGSGKIMIDDAIMELPFKIDLIKTKKYKIQAIPDEANNFVKWSGDIESEQNPYDLYVEDDLRIFCEFEYKMFNIIVTVEPSDAGIITGEGNYAGGDSAILRVTENHGWNFTGWYKNGDIISQNLVYTLVVNSNVQLEAKFEKKIYNLNVIVNPIDGGTVDGSGYYYYEDNVNLTAIPNEGWEFLNWKINNNILSSNPNYQIKVNDNISINANFEKKLYSLSLSSYPQDGGTTSGGGYFYFDETATIFAQENEGWRFDYWSDGDSIISYDSVYTVNVNDNINLTANFSALTDVNYEDIDDFTLSFSNPYPNPFNPSTIFRFSISEPSKVSLAIFDINGQLVENLIKNRDYTPGNYKVDFNTNNLKNMPGLPSGVYFYRYFVSESISGKSTVNSGKLILIK